MTKNGDEPSFFEELKEGLEAGIRYARGELSLRTTMAPDPDLPAERGEVVRLRKQLGKTQKQFALALDVPVTTLRSWEQGASSPTPAQLRQLRMIAAGAEEEHPNRRVAPRSRSKGSPKPRKTQGE
jgi:DNA-binding transcriptional regulator YiaG